MQLLTAGKSAMYGLAFAPDGRALVAPRDRRAPVLWELPASGDPLALPVADPGGRACSYFTFSPDSQVVGWLSGQRRYEYDRRTGQTRAVPLTQGDERVNVQCVCGPDGRLVVRTIDFQAGARIRAFAATGNGWGEAWTVGPSEELRGWQMAGSGGETFFTWEEPHYSVSGSKGLVTRSLLTGEVLARMSVPAAYVSGLTAKADGSALILYRDSSLYYWRPGEKLQKVRTGTLRHYRSLAFHPDGRHLLAGNNDATARLIDAHTWEVVRQYAWDIGRLLAVAVSPDGALAAAGGEKGRVVVWDLDL